MVATHPMIVLEMADHGFDGGTTAHLAADGLGNTPDLAADPDLEPIRIVVAAIALVAMDATDRDTCEPFEIGDDRTESMAVVRVAVQSLGVQHELPALGGGDRRGNRDLAAELVRRARLAAADTLHLGSMQRIDLWPALMLVLMANPQREIEQRAEAVFEHCVALDLAANVTDDATEPGAQELQLPPGAFELVGVRVAPHHDGGPLGQPQIALAELDALALGQLHQLLDRAMCEPGVGRMRDRLLLDGGVHHHPLKILGFDRPGPMRHRQAFL